MFCRLRLANLDEEGSKTCQSHFMMQLSCKLVKYIIPVPQMSKAHLLAIDGKGLKGNPFKLLPATQKIQFNYACSANDFGTYFFK